MAVCAQDGDQAAVRAFSLSALGVAALLGGCVGAPAPQWQSETHLSLEKFRQNYLEGDTRLAERYFAEARMNISATGQLDLAARAELIRCALATASLSDEPCTQFEALRRFATEEEKAYARFLAGRLSPAGVATAVDTASAQGFRRPLLAYLTVQAKLAEKAGDSASLATIRRRIELVSQPLPDGR